MPLRLLTQLDLAIDDVDEASLARIGRWPWPRTQQAVTLFTPVPPAAALDLRFEEEMRLWQLALASYRQQDATQALASLEALRERFATSALSGLYRQLGERVARWGSEPEPPDWDGTRSFDSK